MQWSLTDDKKNKQTNKDFFLYCVVNATVNVDFSGHKAN